MNQVAYVKGYMEKMADTNLPPTSFFDMWSSGPEGTNAAADIFPRLAIAGLSGNTSPEASNTLARVRDYHPELFTRSWVNEPQFSNTIAKIRATNPEFFNAPASSAPASNTRIPGLSLFSKLTSNLNAAGESAAERLKDALNKPYYDIRRNYAIGGGVLGAAAGSQMIPIIQRKLKIKKSLAAVLGIAGGGIAGAAGGVGLNALVNRSMYI